MSRVAAVLGFAAKQVEDTKFKADLNSTLPILAAYGGRHTFVPFAMEDGGRIGAHGQAVLRMLDEHAVAKGKLPPGPRNAAPPWWRYPCGSGGGSSGYPRGSTSPCPARFCGTLHPPLPRGRATLRLPAWQYP